jgi:hypothetical protein
MLGPDLLFGRALVSCSIAGDIAGIGRVRRLWGVDAFTQERLSGHAFKVAMRAANHQRASSLQVVLTLDESQVVRMNQPRASGLSALSGEQELTALTCMTQA